MHRYDNLKVIIETEIWVKSKKLKISRKLAEAQIYDNLAELQCSLKYLAPGQYSSSAGVPEQLLLLHCPCQPFAECGLDCANLQSLAFWPLSPAPPAASP